MKKNNIKTRIIATALSVITVCSIGTMAFTNVHAATDKADKSAYAIGTGLIRQFVPGGVAIAGFLDVITTGTTLNDVNGNINSLRSTITKEFADLKAQLKGDTEAIENKIVNQTVIANKGTNFDTLMTGLKSTERQIESIQNNKEINDKEKEVELAMLLGKSNAWSNNSANLVYQYQSFMDTLSTPSFGDQKNRDFCQVILDDCYSKVMFSGEGIDKAKPYIDRVLFLGLYAYSIEVQCLKAAEDVSKFTDADKAQLSDDELYNYHNIKSLTSVVSDEIKYMNDNMFAASQNDSVLSKYSDFCKTSRLIFVNKNTENKPFQSDLDTIRIGSFTDPEKFKGFANNNFYKESLTKDELNKLAAYVKQEYKDCSFRDYLKKVGFNTDNIPQNTYIMYQGAVANGPEGLYGVTGGFYIDDKNFSMSNVIWGIKGKIFGHYTCNVNEFFNNHYMIAFQAQQDTTVN